MFTGIVEEIGHVAAVETVDDAVGSARLRIACDAVVRGTRVGDSINVNGCCLTVTGLPGDGGFAADVMGETLARTGIGELQVGAPVNLERALRADDRLGGHLVMGHVDATTRVREVTDHGAWTTMTFDLPARLAPYVAEKGSIAVDGVSLTVTEVGERAFAVGLIPHTLAATVLGDRAAGDTVNLEVDVLARYVERSLAAGRGDAAAAAVAGDDRSA